jgi:hypothetical protein
MERIGTRDMEGKVTRVGASESGGERVSIKKEEGAPRADRASKKADSAECAIKKEKGRSGKKVKGRIKKEAL